MNKTFRCQHENPMREDQQNYRDYRVTSFLLIRYGSTIRQDQIDGTRSDLTGMLPNTDRHAMIFQRSGTEDLFFSLECWTYM